MISTLSRRQALLSIGGAALTAALANRPAHAFDTVRQGYQTSLWGMPTYFLMRSGLLEKQGIRFEEFPVAAGNQTMQQQVGRQVDLGTYAGQSMIIGHDKGGLVAVMEIGKVGRTSQVLARKSLNITKVEQLKGMKIANQTGSSVGNIFIDTIAPAAGLKKGDYQEVRMDVNNMVAALSAGTVDAIVSIEPYNQIAIDDGLAVMLTDFSAIDPMPMFMAATPDFIEKSPDTLVAYLKAWRATADMVQNNPTILVDSIHSYYTERGYSVRKDTLQRALALVEVKPGFSADLKPYLEEQAGILLRQRKIASMPDGGKILRPEFWQRANA